MTAVVMEGHMKDVDLSWSLRDENKPYMEELRKNIPGKA